MKKLLALLLAVMMILSFASCGDKKDEEKTQVDLGVIAPLTGSVAQYGTGVYNGVSLAVEEINAAGGILGKQIVIQKFDSKGSETEGVNAINALITNEVDAVIGAVISSVTAAIAPLADEAGMVVVTPTSTADTVTEGYDYVFRTCFADSFQGKLAARYADKLGKTKAAVLYISSDPYSAGLYEAFKAECAALNIELVSVQSTASKDDTDFTTQLTTIQATGVEFLYAPCYYSAIGSYIIPQARNAGYNGIVMGADGYDGVIPYMADPKSMYENVYFTNHYSKDDVNPVVQNFVKSYTDKFGADTLNSFAALGYDAVYMVKQAMEEANTTQDKEAIKAAMADINFSGVTGSFTLDETGTPQKTAALLGFKDGAEIFVESVGLE
ncbi:MAG: ABC transporter substrate-binding protein [Eubacteriaceae bacterium]|nr:ABC transporter substrate-binding protein [Eubacteriaceae bacterium]